MTKWLSFSVVVFSKIRWKLQTQPISNTYIHDIHPLLHREWLIVGITKKAIYWQRSVFNNTIYYGSPQHTTLTINHTSCVLLLVWCMHTCIHAYIHTQGEDRITYVQYVGSMNDDCVFSCFKNIFIMF